MTPAQRRALLARADLLEQEAGEIRCQRITWTGRLRQLGDYGRHGGAASERRLIVEALANLERQRNGDARPRPSPRRLAISDELGPAHPAYRKLDRALSAYNLVRARQ